MRKEVLILMTFKKIYSIQFKTTQDFNSNLEELLKIINNCEKDSIILTPEVALTGFSYQRMEEANQIARNATECFLQASKDKTIITTMIEKNRNHFFNNLKVFHNSELIHKQSKHNLFPLGEEHLHFMEGDKDEIIPFYIDGIKCGALNCFELRFIDLWEKLRGVEIIFVPAQWGLARKNHFESLLKGLALLNQCFVVASNGANQQIARSSSIITPYGGITQDDNSRIITSEINLSEIEKIRKYINIGLE